MAIYIYVNFQNVLLENFIIRRHVASVGMVHTTQNRMQNTNVRNVRMVSQR